MRTRSMIAGVVAAATALLVPGVAHAEAPSNDDFAGATAITALPFHTTENTAEATRAPDDPATCYDFADNSVWFQYTAPQDAVLQFNAHSLDYDTLAAAFTGTPGQLTAVPGVCAFGEAAATFSVTAGTTYYLLVRSYFGGGGALTVDLQAVPPSPNDNVAAASEVTTLPSTFTGDLTRAGAEPGEAPPSCDSTATESVWYVYRPQTRRSVSVFASSFLFAPTVTVYRGTAPANWSEVDCTRGPAAVFGATAGDTFYIRVASDPEPFAPFQVQFDRAPELHPSIGVAPFQPSVLDELQFFPNSGDQLGKQFVSGELRFGDGTSAPIDGSTLIRHRYAADGVYQIGLTGATKDGRTGSVTQSLTIETHDVSIATFTVPARARADQTKPISVTIANTRRDETVQVELFRQAANGALTHIGTLTQFVPARSGRTVTFPFAYTFGAADVTAGSVSFKAVATLPFATRDAAPADNEKVATTTVR